MKISGLFAAAALLCSSANAFAGSLISFTDTATTGATYGLLSDTGANWAVSWSQSVATSNVTLQAIIYSFDSSTANAANWYVTDAIGSGTTAANVVASGTYLPVVGDPAFDYNVLSRVTLGTGLNFAAGTYYLVLDGPTGPYLNNANWVGGVGTTTLASGFSIGSYFSTQATDPFAPAGALTDSGPVGLVFEMSTQSVPEPATWVMMIGGFAMVGAALRRRVAQVSVAI